jgi:hypothetical protein
MGSVADAVLEYLKDDSLKELGKRREIDDLLGTSMWDPMLSTKLCCAILNVCHCVLQ